MSTPITVDQIVNLIYDAIEDATGTRPRNTDPGAALVAVALPSTGQRKAMIEQVIRALYAPSVIEPSATFVARQSRRSAATVEQLATALAEAWLAGRLIGSEDDEPEPRSYVEWVEANDDDARPLPKALGGSGTFKSRKAISPSIPDVGFSLVKIFYATDRAKLAAKPGKVIDYGPRRADGLQLGECDVSIPARHKAGSVERPKWWKFEFAEDPEKHVTLRTVTELGDEDFYSRVSQKIAGSERKEAFVFVHGYNVKFANAARQTAQMAFDLRFDGAPILYSWPSQGTIPGYVVDANTVIWTETHLVDFLTDVATRTGATRVHVIAHSMGNRAVCNALEALSQRATPNLHHVVLTAPDVDADVFRNVVKAFKTLPKTVTLYASSKDKAIEASKVVNGAPRAGEPIVIIPGIDSIDASAVETDFLAHGYFSGTRSVLSDIYNLLQDQPAKSRFDLTPDQHDDGDYYRFKP